MRTSKLFPSWDDIPFRESTDPDCGGPDSAGNKQTSALGNRAEYVRITTNITALSATVTQPSGMEVEGDIYLVPENGTDIFAGNQNSLAVLYQGNWIFIEPRHGWIATLDDYPSRMLRFNAKGGTPLWIPVEPTVGSREVFSDAVDSGNFEVIGTEYYSTLLMTSAGPVASVLVNIDSQIGSPADIMLHTQHAIGALEFVQPVKNAPSALVDDEVILLRWVPVLNAFLAIPSI